MMTETNRGRRHNKSPTLARSRSPPIPEKSSTTSGGGHNTRKSNHGPISSWTNCARRKRKEDRALKNCRGREDQRLRHRQQTRSRKTTRRSPGVGGNKGGKGRLKSSDTSSGSPDLHTVSPSSRASEHLENVEENGETCQAEPPIQSLGETEIDEADLRHRALRKLEEQERKRASDKWQQTADMSVFAPFMAPFISGPDRPNLGSWIWDCSVKRWRREHTLDGRIVWGPTDDCFI